MRRLARSVALATSFALLGGVLGSHAFAQRGHPVPHSGIHPGHVVFVGGYFYDPFFGQYPWWPGPGYPYPYYPAFESRAVLRVLVTPKNAGVYVDGFYAGIVDDFDGFFQGLPLTPGGHEVVLYLAGYRTYRQWLYVAPGTTFKLQTTLTPLPPGEVSEPPVMAPPLPAPPEGTYLPPHTPSAAATMTEAPAAMVGTLDLQVQPAEAEVRIDGKVWASSERGRVVVSLSSGAHRIDVSSAGYRDYGTDLVVPGGETIQLKVTLAKSITP